MPLRFVVALAVVGAATGCSTDNATPARRAAEIQLVSRDPHVAIAGHVAPDRVTVRVVDQHGEPLSDVDVEFVVSSGGGSMPTGSRRTSFSGLAWATWQLGTEGDQRGRAVVQTGTGGPIPAGPEALSLEFSGQVVHVQEPVARMLGSLGQHIALCVQRMQLALPLNQNLSSEMRQKIDMLTTPGLGGDIILDPRVVDTVVTGMDGGEVSIVGVFPLAQMRSETTVALRRIVRAVPVLESFLGTWPSDMVQLWYGFVLGGSGGGAALNVEDRSSYQSRMAPLPYDAMIDHELSHTYVSNETLTQFLELYSFNVLATGSDRIEDWTHIRSYAGMRADNFDVHAVLDVYALVGPEVMSAAYAAVMPLRPRYGQPLDAEMIEAFVSVVPPELREQVAAKLSRVRS